MALFPGTRIIIQLKINSTKMETKFSHEGSKAQRKQEELGNYQASNRFMNFFVPSRLRGIFGSGLSGLGQKRADMTACGSCMGPRHICRLRLRCRPATSALSALSFVAYRSRTLYYLPHHIPVGSLFGEGFHAHRLLHPDFTSFRLGLPARIFFMIAQKSCQRIYFTII